MKITVLGKGNAGVLTALHYAYYTKFRDEKYEIELIYDSNIPTLTVGQATTLELPHFLWEALGTDWNLNKKDLQATQKNGIMYENWGKVNDKVNHGFSFGTYALHYDTQQVQQYIIDKSKGLFNVKITDENVIDYNKIDSDYIFDCRGWPKNTDNYEDLINPLNAVICANKELTDEDRNNINWTRAVATPDGWCFYIPLHNTVSLGYLYNSNITSKEMAESNFRKQFDITGPIRESFPFKQYVAKEPIIDDRIILNGNSLFFLEPLESTAVNTYIEWNRMTYDWLVYNRKDAQPEHLKHRIKSWTKNVQNFILWHYNFGSKFDTPFWSYAKQLSEQVYNDESMSYMLDYAKKTPDWKIRCQSLSDNRSGYAQWYPWSFKLWQDGMTTKNDH